MTDLATRIAEVKHEEVEKMIAAWLEYAPQSMQPMVKEAVALLRHMAARIEELQAKADDWQTMKDELDMAGANYQYLKQDTDNEIAGLRKRNEELEKALEDAAECIESWGGYASTYFQDKHDLAGDIERTRTAARALKGEG
jgi:chromosome segregation ATPase